MAYYTFCLWIEQKREESDGKLDVDDSSRRLKLEAQQQNDFFIIFLYFFRISFFCLFCYRKICWQLIDEVEGHVAIPLQFIQRTL